MKARTLFSTFALSSALLLGTSAMATNGTDTQGGTGAEIGTNIRQERVYVEDADDNDLRRENGTSLIRLLASRYVPPAYKWLKLALH